MHMAQTQLSAEHSQLGRRIRNGSVDPAAWRIDRSVVGSRLKAAVFRTTNVIISSLAIPAGASFAMACMAVMPKGVAALPNPMKFALREAAIACRAGKFLVVFGNILHKSGCSQRVKMRSVPACRAVSIRPPQKHIAPPTVTHRRIACGILSNIPFASACVL